MSVMKHVLLITLILGSWLPNDVVLAAWQDQEEAVSGTWGSAPDQFGIEKGDTIAYDMFPGPIYILQNESIIIRDVLNARYKSYDALGGIRKVLKCVEISPDVYNEECNFDGDYLVTQSDGSLWTYSERNYRKYSSDGTALFTSPTRPLELGKVTKIKDGTQWHYEVEYPDRIYIYDGPRDMLSEKGIIRINANLIMQNLGDKVYAFKVVEEIPVAEGEKKKYKIDKITEWIKPKDDLVFHKNPIDTTIGGDFEIITQYGEAVIGPDGSIYTWMRSETNYKILRWRWVEQ